MPSPDQGAKAESDRKIQGFRGRIFCWRDPLVGGRGLLAGLLRRRRGPPRCVCGWQTAVADLAAQGALCVVDVGSFFDSGNWFVESRVAPGRGQQ